MDRRKDYSPRVSAAIHTFLGATRSVFGTSVISRIRCILPSSAASAET